MSELGGGGDVNRLSVHVQIELVAHGLDALHLNLVAEGDSSDHLHVFPMDNRKSVISL